MRGGWLLLLAACSGRTELGTIKDIALLDAGNDGGGCSDQILATDRAGATAIAVDADRVFWGTADGQVWTRQGGNVSELANENAPITSIALDASSIYFSAGGTIYSGAKGIGVIAPFADKQGQPEFLAVDDQAIYFVDHGSGIAAGRVVRIDKTTKTAKTVMDGLDAPSGLAIDDASVYVTAQLALGPMQPTQGVLLKMAKVGGIGQVLAKDLHDPGRVVVDASNVYFFQQDIAGGHPGLDALDTNGTLAIKRVADLPTGTVPIDVTIDAKHAYATTLAGTTTTLHRIALDGTKDESWVTSVGVIFGAVRASDTAVYWTIDWSSQSPPAAGSPSVRKKCK